MEEQDYLSEIHKLEAEINALPDESWCLSVEQNNNSHRAVKDYQQLTPYSECFVSTVDLLHPKKKTKVEDLSTITLGYIKQFPSERMDRDNLNKRLRVLFDSGCSATLLNKEFCRQIGRASCRERV